MCSLSFGLHSSTEDMELVFDCRYMRSARMVLDYIGDNAEWPQQLIKIDLWPNGSPFLFDLSHAYSATINMCADYIQYLRSHEEAEEPDPAPGTGGENKESA